MTDEPRWNWESGEGLLRMDDPAEVDAAFERGERSLGAAVIGLARNCPPEVVSPRIIRLIEVSDPLGRDFPFTAIGHLARLDGRLTPELYAALRAEGTGGYADNAIRDTLGYVPFRDLPAWFKWRWLVTTVHDKLEGWWLRSVDAVEDAWKALRRGRGRSRS
ncbi:hypothetical protein [Streptomyces sp. NPDC048002]|uniref:hypothetical protein n=1 Tax=Streptomyces sp. NPDC048002 TaxID=3154344 RepID=UPI0033D8694E